MDEKAQNFIFHYLGGKFYFCDEVILCRRFDPQYSILTFFVHFQLPRPVPIFVMIRPRQGNDFHYTKLELDSMVEDIELFRELGADGFVFGALDENGRIDAIANTTLMNACDDLPVTFHRCFDMTPPKDLMINALLIAELGFTRILTSGFAAKAENGLQYIKQLMNLTSDLIVMPGSGVNAKNLEMILKETNAKEFHTSARVEKEVTVKGSFDLGNSDKAVEKVMVCSEDAVKELVEIAKTLEVASEKEEEPKIE